MTESRPWPWSPPARVACTCCPKVMLLVVTGVLPAGRPVAVCPACDREPVGGDTIVPPRSWMAGS